MNSRFLAQHFTVNISKFQLPKRSKKPTVYVFYYVCLCSKSIIFYPSDPLISCCLRPLWAYRLIEHRNGYSLLLRLLHCVVVVEERGYYNHREDKSSCCKCSWNQSKEKASCGKYLEESQDRAEQTRFFAHFLRFFCWKYETFSFNNYGNKATY